MKYRRLGQWGVQVSAIGYGSWLTVKPGEERQAHELHRLAYENGVNFFDTANVYANGAAEGIVGEALRPFRRDTVVLATKVYFGYGQSPFPKVNDRGLSRKHIFEQCARSLRELKTDYIDLYQCHRYDVNAPLVETCRAMNDLIGQGKALYWGVSQWTAAQIDDAVRLCEKHAWHVPVSDQPVYNMLQRDVETEILPMCKRHGLGVVVFSPLAEGVLTGKYRPGQPPPAGSRAADEVEGQWLRANLNDDKLRKAQRIAELAGELGLKPAQLALAWCLRREELSSCIVGASKPEQLLENLKAADATLDDAALKRIERILSE